MIEVLPVPFEGVQEERCTSKPETYIKARQEGYSLCSKEYMNHSCPVFLVCMVLKEAVQEDMDLCP